MHSTALRDRATAEFPEAGWSVRTRTNAAPALSSNIERFSQFLTLVGLTVLVVGGVGVANAVRAYLDGKRGVIATFKSLGASGGFVFLVYLVQIMLIAGLGIAIGLVVGAAMPYVVGALLSSVIPVPTEGGLYPARSGDGRAVRISGDACLCADAAWPGARRARHRIVSRDGL